MRAVESGGGKCTHHLWRKSRRYTHFGAANAGGDLEVKFDFFPSARDDDDDDDFFNGTPFRHWQYTARTFLFCRHCSGGNAIIKGKTNVDDDDGQGKQEKMPSSASQSNRSYNIFLSFLPEQPCVSCNEYTTNKTLIIDYQLHNLFYFLETIVVVVVFFGPVVCRTVVVANTIALLLLLLLSMSLSCRCLVLSWCHCRLHCDKR
jgi:hypothetical protein